ncbi:MAG: zf-HC2 domain-containing protein [Acidobacteriota bacterium]
MTDEQIEQHQIIDRYLMGKLPPHEAARFEEHYLSCPQCLEQLEMAETMLKGFKTLAAQEATGGAGAGRRFGGRPALVMGWRAVLAAAAALAGLLIFPPLLFYLQMGTLDDQLEAARQELALTRQSGEQDRRSLQSLQQELGQARSSLAEQQQAVQEKQNQFDLQLAQERSARRQLSRDLLQAFQPQANTPVFPLNPVRSATAGAADLDQIVRLSSRPEWVVLSLELENPQAGAYQASLFRLGEDRPLWQGGGLEPNYMDALTVSFHSSFLQAGDYELRVEAPSSGPGTSFAFRVISGD